jgi:excisionase family DNA binding protein
MALDGLRDFDTARELLGGISEPFLFKLMRTGQLPFVKVGDRTMFRPQDLEEFIERNVQLRAPEREPISATS